MVNPDGVDLVNGVLRNDRYKNETLKISARYPDIPYPNGWKANGFGWLMKVNLPVCVLSVLPIRQTWPIPKTG